MAWYDREWGRFATRGYDRPNFTPRRGYDEPRPRPYAFDAFDEPIPVYGPERYGLGPYHERLRKRRRPDDELAEDVRDALFYDTWVDAEAIEVEVEDGVVTLTGELPSYEEIRYATDDAWDVEGVIGVRSELKLRD